MAEIKDKVVTTESLKALHDYNKDAYMTKINPVADGSLSINRKEGTTIGENSVAIGYNTESSGTASYAEGNNTKSTGQFTHTEGNYTEAKGYETHAEGLNTIACGTAQHVQGKYNIEDTEFKYAHIVGNGNTNKRSNAHTVDWDGNAWYAGDISVNGDIILTNGQYGDTLPAAGIKGRIFFKKLSE